MRLEGAGSAGGLRRIQDFSGFFDGFGVFEPSSLSTTPSGSSGVTSASPTELEKTRPVT